MRPVAPYFVEHADRLFETVEMDEPPRGRDGNPRRCVLNLTEQRFEFAPGVGDDQRGPLIRRTLRAATGEPHVPVVGRVPAGG